MNDAQHITIGPEDDGQRLDRWLKKQMSFALAQKLIRKGAIRVDGKKAKPDTRLAAGQKVRIPAIENKPQNEKPQRTLTDKDRDYIASLVLYDDGDIAVFDKPAGLASQGGGSDDHIDAYFPLLEKNGMIPRLIHRLDRDTSGLLLTARSAGAVRQLGKSFKNRNVRKIYWAVTLGVPEQNEGTIRAPLAKIKGPHKDKVTVDDQDGKFAETDFAVVEKLGGEAAFVMFWPRTGRTHQIRVHAAEILQCPVLGDQKYQGQPGEEMEGLDIAPRLHLHAHRLVLPHPLKKDAVLDFTAPLPDLLQRSWKALGFNPAETEDIFADQNRK